MVAVAVGVAVTVAELEPAEGVTDDDNDLLGVLLPEMLMDGLLVGVDVLDGVFEGVDVAESDVCSRRWCDASSSSASRSKPAVRSSHECTRICNRLLIDCKVSVGIGNGGGWTRLVLQSSAQEPRFTPLIPTSIAPHNLPRVVIESII